VLVEHYVNRSSHQSYVGNVYLGKVQNVLPSMEAAFVDVGKGRNAVLYAGEVNFDVSGMEGQPRRIESALKAGQSLLVRSPRTRSVTRGPADQPGQPARPLLVYVPGASMTGISASCRHRTQPPQADPQEGDAGERGRHRAHRGRGAAEEELSRDVSRLAPVEAIEKKSRRPAPPRCSTAARPDTTAADPGDMFPDQRVVSRSGSP